MLNIKIFLLDYVNYSNNNKMMDTHIQTVKNKNCKKSQKLNLLFEFKKIKSANRVKELKKIIKENTLKYFQINPPQLKEFLGLFAEHHKFIALQLVKPFLFNTDELKNIELKSTQLVSVLSLFHTLSRYIVLETLIPMFVNSELTKLNKFELQAAQLKAILFLFANSDRLKALKLLNENFDIKINLNETDIKELETCLARDSDFKNLLSSDKKKIWNSFFVKNEEHSDIHSIHRQKQINNISKQNNTARCQALLKANKNLSTKFAGDVIPKNNSMQQTSFPDKLVKIFKHNNLPQMNNVSKKAKIKNESLKSLSIKINERQPRERLDFFKKYVKAQKLQIVLESTQEICEFIKLFPPHDAIEFLELPYIQDQIKNLQQQKTLTKEAYKDLLNYLPENFNKRLLSSISPATLNRSSARIFKVSNTDSNSLLPDLIPREEILLKI